MPSEDVTWRMTYSAASKGARVRHLPIRPEAVQQALTHQHSQPGQCREEHSQSEEPQIIHGVADAAVS